MRITPMQGNRAHIFKTILRPVAYPAIDGLRFYAALSVFLEHVIGSAWVSYFHLPIADLNYNSPKLTIKMLSFLADGNHGVDEFFLISGFLMVRIVVTPSKFNYGRFIINRIRRIYPAFLISLIIATAGDCLLFGWPWHLGDFLGNLVFLNAIPGNSTIPYNSVSWSLGFEFAFYLIIPAMLLLTKLMDPRVAAIFVALACHWLIPDAYIRMNALFIGAIIGAFADEQLRNIARPTPLWLIAPAYLLCLAYKPFLDFKTFYYWSISAAALLMIKVTWDQECWFHKFFAMHWIRWLGTLSYSIYLLHSIIASVVLFHLAPQPPTRFGFVCYILMASALTIIAAFTSYVLIEQPYFRNGRHHRRFKQVKAA